MKKGLLGMAAVAAVVALSACQSAGQAGQVAKAEPAQKDTCGLAAAQQFVGKDAAVLETIEFAGPVRILRPNTAATMDYRENRLNFSVDDKGIVTRAYCA